MEMVRAERESVWADDLIRAQAATLERQAFEPVQQLLMGLTHAFSNLVMPVREYPKLLARQLEAGSPASAILENIQTAADRLGVINENLNQLCHGSEGEPMPVDLGGVVMPALDAVEAGLSADARITLRLTLPEASLEAHVQPDAVTAAVQHLVANATQFMPDGGVVDVEVGERVVEAGDAWTALGLAAGRYAVVRVGDQGTGVAASCRDTLFLPFVTTIRGEGRGLGLSFVYRVAQAHGGAVLYAPDRQPGAEFLLVLPI